MDVILKYIFLDVENIPKLSDKSFLHTLKSRGWEIRLVSSDIDVLAWCRRAYKGITEEDCALSAGGKDSADLLIVSLMSFVYAKNPDATTVLVTRDHFGMVTSLNMGLYGYKCIAPDLNRLGQDKVSKALDIFMMGLITNKLDETWL